MPVSSSSSVPGEGRDLPAQSVNQGEAEARYKPLVAQREDSSAPCLSWLGARVASPQAAVPSHVAHGATQSGSLARTRPALCESICDCSGYVSSSSTGSPGVAWQPCSPSTHARWILLPPVPRARATLTLCQSVLPQILRTGRAGH